MGNDLRTKHNGFEENTRRYEEGDFMVRSVVRWNAWRGISVSAGSMMRLMILAFTAALPPSCWTTIFATC